MIRHRATLPRQWLSMLVVSIGNARELRVALVRRSGNRRMGHERRGCILTVTSRGKVS
jgi:hypothetical protein